MKRVILSMDCATYRQAIIEALSLSGILCRQIVTGDEDSIDDKYFIEFIINDNLISIQDCEVAK